MRFLKTSLILASGIFIGTNDVHAFFSKKTPTTQKSQDPDLMAKLESQLKKAFLNEVKEMIREIIPLLNSKFKDKLSLKNLKAKLKKLKMGLSRSKSESELSELLDEEDLEELHIIETKIDSIINENGSSKKFEDFKVDLRKDLIFFERKIFEKLKSVGQKIENSKLGSKVNCKFAYTVKNLKSKDFLDAQDLYSRAQNPKTGKCRTNLQQKDTKNFRNAMLSMNFEKKENESPISEFIKTYDGRPIQIETFGYIYTNDLNFSDYENHKKLPDNLQKLGLEVIVEERTSRAYFVSPEQLSKLTKLDPKFLTTKYNGILVLKAPGDSSGSKNNSGPEEDSEE
ncbi:MAG TPA: hypothetical protein VI959_01275 [Alphaproteobacteria bacterium]|nr:hypothetical protein [Alphaproteobacteria bacterium]